MLKREAHFGYLLAALIAYLLLGPIAGEFFGEKDGLVLMIALCSVLVIGIFSLHDTNTYFIVGVVLAVIAVALTALDYYVPDNGFIKVLALSDIFIFFALSIGLAASNLIATGPVTLNRITGGICIYLLLGMCWSIAYINLIWLNPGAISGLHVDAQGNPLFWEVTYFSFVTLTTLGYGDMTPLTPFARALAYTQAVTGQLYIAILIGSMVGNYAGRSLAKN